MSKNTLRRSMVRYLSDSYSVDQIADVLGLHPVTVYRILNKAEMDAISIRETIATRNRPQRGDIGRVPAGTARSPLGRSSKVPSCEEP